MSQLKLKQSQQTKSNRSEKFDSLELKSKDGLVSKVYDEE